LNRPYAFSFASGSFGCSESKVLLMSVESMTEEWPLSAACLMSSIRRITVVSQLKVLRYCTQLSWSRIEDWLKHLGKPVCMLTVRIFYQPGLMSIVSSFLGYRDPLPSLPWVRPVIFLYSLIKNSSQRCCQLFRSHFQYLCW